MYPLFIDKNEEFNCKITIEGADNGTANPRLLLKTKKWDLMFEGVVKNGQCIIPLKKLSSLIGEGETGEIKLEVIVDDTLLVPWENTFEAKVSKKVKVDVSESYTSTKPKIVVEVAPAKKQQYISPTVNGFSSILKEHNINSANAKFNTKKINKLFKEYISLTSEKDAAKLMNGYKTFIKTALINSK
jgi:hypothetical protein